MRFRYLVSQSSVWVFGVSSPVVATSFPKSQLFFPLGMSSEYSAADIYFDDEGLSSAVFYCLLCLFIFIPKIVQYIYKGMFFGRVALCPVKEVLLSRKQQMKPISRLALALISFLKSPPILWWSFARQQQRKLVRTAHLTRLVLLLREKICHFDNTRSVSKPILSQGTRRGRVGLGNVPGLT